MTASGCSPSGILRLSPTFQEPPIADARLCPADFPPRFVEHNQAAPDWLAALPDLVDWLAGRWSLTLAPPYPHIAYNYVAPATRADGTRCVFKLSHHVGETRHEIAALRLWDGDGAARLFQTDPEVGALLLERLEPGTMLAEVAESDDDAATVVAAAVLRRLWRPVADGPDLAGLRSLASWCDAYERNRAALVRGVPGFPMGLFQWADELRRELLASTVAPTVLHGDMHHFNVLRAQRAEWLAIDPKGLAGDRCFDVGQFLRNPRPVPPAVNRRRLDILCAELGLDRRRTADWCLVHAVLDACWAFEDGEPIEPKIAYAEQALTF